MTALAHTLPLQILARDLRLSPQQEEEIRQRAEQLRLRHPLLSGARATVGIPHRGPTGSAHELEVRLDLLVPGAEVVVRRRGTTELLDIIQSAFRAAERQLRELRRRQVSRLD